MRGEDINHVGEREKRRWSIGAGCETAEWMGSGPTDISLHPIHPSIPTPKASVASMWAGAGGGEKISSSARCCPWVNILIFT